MELSTIGLDPASHQVRAATIHVAKGPDAGRQVKLAQVSFVVGVGDGADLRLTDPSVSREHLRITLEPNGVRVRDGGSKNGTFLGGVRVNDVTLSGDTALTIGGTTLTFSISTDSLVLPLSTEDRFGDAIGSTVVMRHLFAQLERAARSELTVLIEGESGVGKDILAQAIHAKSPRKEGPFVVADCGGIPANLIESELFGHERGAFTGADKTRKGLVEEANGGTLFLDEVGELPLELQPKLLRMMEAREVRPVGSNKARPVDVRIVAATNRRLAEAARTGEFRDDLFYRLAVIRVVVPALRERADDIVPIATAMLRRLKGDPDASIPADFASMLTASAWPGNVRELRNVVERYAVFGKGDDLFTETKAQARTSAVELAQLPYHEAKKIVMDRFEDEYLPEVLDRAGGVISKAAEYAGVARPSFYRMIERVRPGYTVSKKSIPTAVARGYDVSMGEGGDLAAAPKSGLGSAIASVVLALLQFVVCVVTGYYCAMWAYAMGFLLPLSIGGPTACALFALAIAFGVRALANNGRQYVAIAGIVLSVLAFGGCYGGCAYKTKADNCGHTPNMPTCD